MRFLQFHRGISRALSIALLGVLVSACAKQTEDPKTFLPKVRNPLGVEAEALRAMLCSPERISFRDGLLHEANIRNVFDCANYDKSLAPIEGLIKNQNFPAFITNVNKVVGAKTTQDFGKTLRDWLEPQSGNQSKIDELLPVLTKVIKNPVFQEALPVVHNILQDGQDIWRELLPSLADLVYTERFQYTFDDLSTLFSRQEKNGQEKEAAPQRDYSKRVKLWAQFLASRSGEGDTAAANILELLDEVRDLKLPDDVKLLEYADHLSVKGVFVALYQESGRIRGEEINSNLNASPDADENPETPLTPKERQNKAHRKLFEGGENAPIVQLASLVHEFNQSHPQFFSAIATWFAGEGKEKVGNEIIKWVAEFYVREAIRKINPSSHLLSAAIAKFGSARYKVKPEVFSEFLIQELAAEGFDSWLKEALVAANQEKFGPNNATLLAGSRLKADILDLYKSNAPAIAEFSKTIFVDGKGEPVPFLPVSQAVNRFGNKHKDLQLSVGNKTETLDTHIRDAWMGAAKTSLGENIVINKAAEFATSFFNDFANGFPNKKTSISKWYYQSAYGNPGSTEGIAAYAFRELNALKLWEENREYLKTEFAAKVFTTAADRRAFQLLVDQVPNIWLYVKSGMLRSGNDLTRVLAERDDGYLIRNYVELITTVTENGMLARAVSLYSRYLDMEAKAGLAKDPEPYEDKLEERRQLQKGTQALSRLMSSLLDPEVPGDYKTSTAYKLLVPFTGLVKDGKRANMERLLVRISDEVLTTSDDKINDFFDGFGSGSKDRKMRVETYKAASDLLKNEKLPEIVGHVRGFFDDDAVRPALVFFAEKYDDGTIDRVLLFIRRILGLRGAR